MRWRGASVVLITGLTTCTPAARATATPDPTPANVQEVVILNYKFHPSLLTVLAGTTVRWVNRDVALHTVTRDGFGEEPFDSGKLGHDQVFWHTFHTAGTYSYLCSPHRGMQGAIVVK